MDQVVLHSRPGEHGDALPLFNTSRRVNQEKSGS